MRVPAAPRDSQPLRRGLIVEKTGHRMLRDQGITLIVADGPDAFVEETPTAVLIRQVHGAVAQFEKAAFAATLKGCGTARRPNLFPLPERCYSSITRTEASGEG